MGNVMRRYWVPALLSWEVPQADCPPVRLKLLGESLIGFRDTSGRVGLLDEFCAHRKASLFLGRNEEHGLRCVFHGWKYDVEGQCVDMPCEPPDSRLAMKIRLKAYATLELGGIIWAYMGPQEKLPPPPKFDWTQVPDTHRQVTKTWEECNWLQALEGGLDTAHVSYLHFGGLYNAASALSPDHAAAMWARSRSPDLEVDVTDYGYHYAGIRPLEAMGTWVRGYHYVMPWTQIRPAQLQGSRGQVEESSEWKPLIAGHYWVPMDDENCIVWNWHYTFGPEALSDDERRDESAGPENVYEDRGFRKKRNRDNDWLIDRDAQKTRSFTGIRGINTQDHAIQESMGPIVDRTTEHLGTVDKAIIATRRLLLQAVKTVEAGGDPPGVAPAYYTVRAIEKVIRPGADWRAELLPNMHPEPDLTVAR